MPFTIPNVTAAGFTDQAEPDSVDIDILTAGHAITGVVSGCAVTAQGVPDMTVAVAAGTISVLGVNQAVASGNVTITAAHSTLARKDIVVVSSAGAKSVVAGTAAAQPLKPAIPANSVVLAEVYVPAADTAINSNQITDKGVLVQASLTTAYPHLIARKTSDQSVTSSTALVNCTAMAAPVGVNEVWKLEWVLVYAASTTGDFKFGWTFPAGGGLNTYQLVDDPSGALSDNLIRSSSYTSGSGLSIAAPTASPAYATISIPMMYFNGGTAGSLQLQFAQNVSDATATTVKTNSTVWGVKIA